MISVVCVYNDATTFENCLVDGLRQQTSGYELVPVDNRDGRFGSAAAALNWGAAQARSEWVMFAHQDVRLLSPDWLARAEEYLAGLGAGLGWAGVAGVASDGEVRGFLIDRDTVLGEPFAAPAEVQTLDECVLICRASPEGQYFDEQLGGWHVYGVDVCCRAIRAGRINYVLPLLAHHDSRSVNVAGLADAHRAIWNKHGSALGLIWTSMGRIGPPARRPGLVRGLIGRAARLVRREYSRLVGVERTRFNHYAEVIDELLADQDTVTVLHGAHGRPPIEVTGLYPQTRRPRRVIHTFDGFDPDRAPIGAVIVPPSLSSGLVGRDGLPDIIQQAGLAIVCLPVTAGRAGSRLAAQLRARADRTVRGHDWTDHGPEFDFFRLTRAGNPI